MTVITDKRGKVISTYIPSESPGRDDPIFHIGPGLKQKQTVHELDLSEEYKEIKSADELHKRVSEHLKKVAPKKRK
jgi:hypothetical protein